MRRDAAIALVNVPGSDYNPNAVAYGDWIWIGPAKFADRVVEHLMPRLKKLDELGAQLILVRPEHLRPSVALKVREIVRECLDGQRMTDDDLWIEVPVPYIAIVPLADEDRKNAGATDSPRPAHAVLATPYLVPPSSAAFAVSTIRAFAAAAEEVWSIHDGSINARATRAKGDAALARDAEEQSAPGLLSGAVEHAAGQRAPKSASDDWLSTDQIRKRLRVRSSAVVAAMQAGDLRYEQRGKRRYARLCDVKAWEQSRLTEDKTPKKMKMHSALSDLA